MTPATCTASSAVGIDGDALLAGHPEHATDLQRQLLVAADLDRAGEDEQRRAGGAGEQAQEGQRVGADRDVRVVVASGLHLDGVVAEVRVVRLVDAAIAPYDEPYDAFHRLELLGHGEVGETTEAGVERCGADRLVGDQLGELRVGRVAEHAGDLFGVDAGEVLVELVFRYAVQPRTKFAHRNLLGVFPTLR